VIMLQGRSDEGSADRRPAGGRRLWRIVRHAFLSLRRRPGNALLIVFTISVAVGGNLVVLHAVRALWTSPSHIPDARRLVLLVRDGEGPGTDEGLAFTESRLRQLEEAHSQVFAGVAGQVATSGFYAGQKPALWLDGVGDGLEVAAVSTGYWRVVGIVVKGREFSAVDDAPGAEAVAIISDRVWRTAFQADPSVIGRLVKARPLPLRIVGVAPGGFHGIRHGEAFDVWIPAGLTQRFTRPGMTRPGPPSLLALARLRAGMTATEAERAFFGADRTGPYSTRGLSVVEASRVFGTADSPTIIAREGAALTLAGSLAGLLLVAACTTVLALIAMSYERRADEFAIRLMLGESPSQLAQSLAAEGVVLALVGAAGASAVAAMAWTIMPAVRSPARSWPQEQSSGNSTQS
jgi:putative ABC transport system permease protein